LLRSAPARPGVTAKGGFDFFSPPVTALHLSELLMALFARPRNRARRHRDGQEPSCSCAGFSTLLLPQIPENDFPARHVHPP
jgi:hypothetical protein